MVCEKAGLLSSFASSFAWLLSSTGSRGRVQIADTMAILRKPAVEIFRRHLLSHLRNIATVSR